jgi:ATP phosphoribosyltransferase
MKGPSVLSLVLPKGSLEAQVLELFSGADLAVIRGGDRDYAARIDDPRIDRVRFLRPQEIPTYVEQGIFDLGISGRDWVTETGADVVSLGEIGGGRAGESVVSVVLAVPRESPWNTVRDLPEGVRISTEMPETTKRFLEEHGVKGRVFTSHGATEAKIPDIVDAIVDLTETGSSLRKAGLKVIETLLTSRTELLANRAAYDDPEKRAAMEDITLLLQGALRARGHVLLKLNVPVSALDDVLAVLPSMASPTVMPLAAGDLRAVETVVPKRGVNTLLPALRAAGARDILELPISKIVE